MTESLDIPGHKVLARLGRGGMAEVYLARDEKLARLVAVKVMDARLNEDPSFVRRFEREARTAASLNHPNIVPVHQFGAMEDGRRYLTMSYFEVGSLRDRLRAGPLPPEEALAIVRQIAGALALAHSRRIVHRDIKPDNILFQGEAASLTDFGIAKLMDATTQLTEAGSPGTLKYMSPEQAKGEAVDQRTDLYALGVVLYEMLTGALPIDAPSLPAMVYRIVHEPPGALPQKFHGLQPLLDALLAKEQAGRVGTATELIQIIQALERNLTRGVDMDHVMQGVVIKTSSSPAPAADLDATDAHETGVTSLLPRPAEATSPPREPTAPTALPRAPTTPSPSTSSLTLSTGPGVVSGASRTTVPTLAMAPAADPATATLGAAAPPTTLVMQAPRSALPWSVAGAAVALLVALAIWVFFGRASTEELPLVDAAPVPAVGGLSVISEPPNALVVLDGLEIGRTPVNRSDVAVGNHLVEVQLPGYAAYRAAEVQVQTDRATALNIQLQPAVVDPAISTDDTKSAAADTATMAQLFVEVEPADARVLLLDRPERFAQGMLLPPGSYRIRAQREGYGAVEKTLELAAGEFRERIVLVEQFGQIALTVVPADARVTIEVDGQRQAYEPGMKVRVGNIRVRAQAEGYADFNSRYRVDEQGLRQTIALKDRSARPSAPNVATFTDGLNGGGAGPTMVNIRAGEFRMGDLNNRGANRERPVHTVRIGAFAVSQHEVTVAEFERFVKAASYVTDAERNAEDLPGCLSDRGTSGEFDWIEGRYWKDPGFAQGADHPVVCVSWNDARAYAQWLGTQTGKSYRLLSESEWEYVARAGATNEYGFGNQPDDSCRYGNVADRSAKGRYGGWAAVDCSDGFVQTAPVGQFSANAFGLHDTSGNVWEWVEDCFRETYRGVPADGRAFSDRGCDQYLTRGGAWLGNPLELRSAYRGLRQKGYRSIRDGFRVARGS